VGFHPRSAGLSGSLGLKQSRRRVTEAAALELTDHHASHDTTTESAFNPFRRVGTKLAHLATLLTV
jgi:hypothetical protein